MASKTKGPLSRKLDDQDFNSHSWEGRIFCVKDSNVWLQRKNNEQASCTRAWAMSREWRPEEEAWNAKAEGGRKQQPPGASKQERDMIIHQNIILEYLWEGC